MRNLFLLVFCSLLVGLCNLALASEPWVITDTAAKSAASDIDVTTFVHPIRTSHGTEGGCVSVGNGTLQTVAHIFYTTSDGGLTWVKKPNGATGDCEVSIDGKWKPARYRIFDNSDKGDVALVQVAGDIPAAKRRQHRYMERVTIYGLKTGYLQCGVVSASRKISLNENEKGTLNGDSGGGVFSEDGDFLGTIQGGDEDEKRVVTFRPNNFEFSFASASAVKAPAPTAVATTTVCENGVCRQVPVVQQPAAQNGHWEQRVGLFGRTHMVWVPNK